MANTNIFAQIRRKNRNWITTSAAAILLYDEK
jgi:hypothetical protein